VQLFMSIGTLVLGLLMVFLTTSSELALFGWALAGLGLLGVVLRFVLPPVTRRGVGR
jgi:hypothetical protein